MQLHGLHLAGGTEIRHERTFTMREIFRLREHAEEWLGLLDVDDEYLAYLLGERLHQSCCEPPPEEECERLMLARLHELEGEYRAAAARPAREGGGRRRLTHTVLDLMPARLTLSGVEGKNVRRFLRAVQDGRHEEDGVRALLGLADCSDEVATGVLADLESLGVIAIDAADPDPDGASLSVGPAGRALAGAASATYTRAAALDAIARFVEAALAMNEDVSSLYVVRFAAVFGSILRDAATVGDVDVAIELLPRDPESFPAEWERRQTEELKKRNHEWWQIPPDYVRREAEKILAANSPVLSFCPLPQLRPGVLAGGTLTVIDDFRPIPGAVDDLRRMDGAVRRRSAR